MFTNLADYIRDTQAYLWRPNDADLAAALPKIIRQAESRIRTDLKLQESEKSLEQDITTNPWPLPTDLEFLRTIRWDLRGPGNYTTPRDFSRAVERPLFPGRIRESYRRVNDLDFTVVGRDLLHRQTVSATSPKKATLVYQPRAGSITDQTPYTTLYNAYEDLFDWAVYSYAAVYLHNEERAQAFDAKYLSRLSAALGEENMRRYGEGPLKMQMPRRDVS